MKNDKLKIDFVTDYISSYERKIKTLNKCGLFDEAKLFEHFALEVCELFYDKKFENLNFTVHENYPCVDLKSVDGELFIQVSTCKDYDSKIYNTLVDIRDSDNEDIKSLKSVNFFFLNYDNEKVTDRAGKKKIGNFDFKREKNLITTADLLKKCEKNGDFLNKLFNLLKGDEDSIRSYSSLLYNSIEQSRNDLDLINSVIGDDYKINRSELVKTIKECESSIVAILGNAGCGKTVVAKSICEDENVVLFKRADEIANKSRLFDVWGFDLKTVIELANNKTFYIVVDSLEFIADSPNKFSLIAFLCKIANDNKNVRLIFTCRTFDFQSFSLIQKQYLISTFTVGVLSNEELQQILKDFPVLNIYKTNKLLIELFRIPFYLNIALKCVGTEKKPNADPTSFKKRIFDEIICCKKACAVKRVDYKTVRSTVLEIASKRAKNFEIDLDKNDFDIDAVSTLLSEGVLTEKNGRIRLKFDIFEDICFGEILEKYFYECKEDISDFIKFVSNLGKCAPRRFQIWVDDMLYDSKKISRILLPIVFNDNYEFWCKQAIISIVKSQHSSFFFENFSFKIADSKYISRFIDCANLYAHQIRSAESKLFDILVSEPFGLSRNYIINLIFENSLFKNQDLKIPIGNMCKDVANSNDSFDSTRQQAIKILEQYFDELFSQPEIEIYHCLDRIYCILDSIYILGKFDPDWIAKLWKSLIENVNSHSELEMVSSKIIERTLLSFSPVCLDKLYLELFDLAEKFWTSQEMPSPFGYRSLERYDEYGLGHYSEQFEFEKSDSFLKFVFLVNPIKATECAITLVNHLISNFVVGKKIMKIKINYNSKRYSYYLIPNLWLCFVKEGYNIPKVICDTLFYLKEAMISLKDKQDVLNEIKDILLTKSNNIGFLSVLNVVGISLFDTFPGYSIELMQAPELLYLDLQRFTALNPTSAIAFLENQIFKKVGLFVYEDKYNKNTGKNLSIREYVIKTSLKNTNIKKYIFAELDKLYRKYKNDKNTLFQIEYMDLRKYNIENTKNKLLEKNNKEDLISSTSGIKPSIKEIVDLFQKCEGANKTETAKNLEKIIKLEIKERDGVNVRNEQIIDSIFVVLQMEETTKEFRNYCISFWTKGILDSLEGNMFLFSENKFFVLLNQLDNKDLEKSNRAQILKIIYLLKISNFNNDGIFNILTKECISFVEKHDNIAEKLFYSICDLSIIEHNKAIIGETNYQTKRNDNINLFTSENKFKHLFNENNIDSCDEFTLGRAINCGIHISESNYPIIKIIYKKLLDYILVDRHKYFSLTCDLEDFLKRQLVNQSKRELVLKLMFDEIDFSKANRDLISFYNQVFSYLKPLYLDAKDSEEQRYSIEKFIEMLDDKIETSILDKQLKEDLYASLIFSGDSYFADLSKVEKWYSDYDKSFLAKIFSKYAFYNYDKFFLTIRQLDIKLLMPNIIISFNDTFKNLKKFNPHKFDEVVKTKSDDIEFLIYMGMNDYIEEIRLNKDLSDAFESLLNILVSKGWVEAAIALDIFIAH